jgi:serine/threonine-protein kinase
MGQYEDKHARLHEVYAVAHHRGADAPATTHREGPATGYTYTRPSATQALAAEDVQDIEIELARHIGPLAKVLVKKALPRAPTLAALREALAPSIQEKNGRDAFIAGTTSQGRPDSQPVSGKRGSSKPPSQLTGLAPSIPVVARSTSKSVPFGSVPPSKLAPNPLLSLEAAEAAAIESALSKYIGPMAKMIVRKEASRTANFKDFVTAIAGNIDQPTQRDQFLAALKRSLVKRY